MQPCAASAAAEDWMRCRTKPNSKPCHFSQPFHAQAHSCSTLFPIMQPSAEWVVTFSRCQHHPLSSKSYTPINELILLMLRQCNNPCHFFFPSSLVTAHKSKANFPSSVKIENLGLSGQKVLRTCKILLPPQSSSLLYVTHLSYGESRHRTSSFTHLSTSPYRKATLSFPILSPKIECSRPS